MQLLRLPKKEKNPQNKIKIPLSQRRSAQRSHLKGFPLQLMALLSLLQLREQPLCRLSDLFHVFT